MTVFVTGIGLISALGMNAGENLEAIQQNRSGIRWSDKYNMLLGEVPMSNEELSVLCELEKKEYSRTSLLGLLAVREARRQIEHHPNIRTGLVAATSIGGIDRTEQHYLNTLQPASVSGGQKFTFDNGGTTEVIADAMGIHGHVWTISTACSSGANAIMHGARLIESGRLDQVIVVGSDPLAWFNIHGFASLGICDSQPCRPFDKNRSGLNLGEGAGCLILENEYSISTQKTRAICTISGWHNATDAYHQTASSPEGKGATIAMKMALKKAGLAAGDIHYINAHGTGTGNNDLSESIAIKNVFGENIPPFSSTKSFTGHTLGAAGAVEAVFCVQSLIEQGMPANLLFKESMPETGMTPLTTYTRSNHLQHILSNSFGFGGNCTSIIFSRS